MHLYIGLCAPEDMQQVFSSHALVPVLGGVSYVHSPTNVQAIPRTAFQLGFL